MSHNWDSSRRPKDPPGWSNTRQVVIQRAGGLCQDESGCTHKGSDVDHIVNLAAGGSHDLNNLRLLCTWHHKRKTSEEAADARKLKAPLSESRPRGVHPGLIG
jgi:5-methylcytosine-specific restriction protein A